MKFVIKARHSIFYGTPLEYLLQELEVDRLVLTGQVTEQCVLYSALDAYVRNYEVAVPARRGRPHPRGPRGGRAANDGDEHERRRDRLSRPDALMDRRVLLSAALAAALGGGADALERPDARRRARSRPADARAPRARRRLDPRRRARRAAGHPGAAAREAARRRRSSRSSTTSTRTARARGTRQNARGVDLNRNFPHRWRAGAARALLARAAARRASPRRAGRCASSARSART